MAAITTTVTSDAPDGVATSIPSLTADGAGVPVITGLPSSDVLNNFPASETAPPDTTSTSQSGVSADDGGAEMHTQVVPEKTNGGLESSPVSGVDSDAEMNTQVMPGGTFGDMGSIPKGVPDPLPHIMPGTGKPQTKPLDSAIDGDTSGTSATAPPSSVPSGRPMASPVMKRHWWRV